MEQISLAASERRALSDLLERVGPQAPTLCAGWTTRDLAAHLVIRENRPDAAVGVLLSPLAGYTARVQRAAAQRPWKELVEQVRGGPPWWAPTRLPRLADKIDGIEFFVHHEDVRRAQPGWQPRRPDPQRAARLWALLPALAQLCYRKSPVGVVLRRPDRLEYVANRREPTVTVIGEPEELVLHAYGREQTVLDFEGDQADVAGLQRSKRGI